MSLPSFLHHLDHSLLAPTATEAELEAAARTALELEVAALCIVPYFVPRAAELLRGSDVRVCTVISFPHGNSATAAKLREAELALSDGATELDVVVNVSRVRSGSWGEVDSEIQRLTRLTQDGGGRIKWIFETSALRDEEKIRLCQLCAAAGADWVKTSTGFGAHGATPGDVELLRRHSPPEVQVKASGGITTYAEVERYLALGASRIGTSRSRALFEEWSQSAP